MHGALIDRSLLAAFRWQSRHAMRLREQDEVTLPSPPRSGSAALYLHVPFCEVLCPFCSFHRVQYREGLAKQYFAALRTELRRYHAEGYIFTGVYVGGGTPTVAPDELVETLALIRQLFPLVKDISVETNPHDLRDGLLAQLAAVGVNRLSVGVQSFDDALLKEMDRFEKYGSGERIIAHLEEAAGHFPTLNVDMIYNLPHQSRASLEHDLEVLLGLKANQVSLYPLMTSKSTTSKMSQTMGLPRQGAVRDQFDLILARLRPTFAPQSGWCFSRGGGAIDEYIVQAEDYVGLGSGAFSYLDGTMYATTFSIQSYIDRVNRGLPAITGRRPLSSAEQMKQTFLMRLFGLSLDKAWARQRHGDGFERAMWPTIKAFKALGAVVEDEKALRLTDEGMYFWVLMMSAFFESVNTFREQMRGRIKAELEDISDLAQATPAPPAAPG
jgi:coproporphyrinogen III oxidase-like Fe-S oxidoreductase